MLQKKDRLLSVTLTLIHLNDECNVVCFAYHFLPGNGRGGLPLTEVFLGVVDGLRAGTVRELTVTLTSRTELRKSNCSLLRPGKV